MSFDLDRHRKALRQHGYWTDRHFDDCLREALARDPQKLAVANPRASGLVELSFAELEDRIARTAGGLRALGVGAGDVVAMQLPNWWEFAVVFLATQRIGAIINPLMPIFRERELRYMLGFAKAKVFVVPHGFGTLDYTGCAKALRDELDSLQHVIVVGGTGEDSLEALMARNQRVDLPKAGTPAVTDPGACSVLMYTSGTTGSPKGVQHTVNTLINAGKSITERAGLTEQDVILVGSPVGHMLGLAAGMLLAICNGNTMVLQEVWSGSQALALIGRYGVSYCGGATPFLNDLVREVKAGGDKPESLRIFLCAGAPIPPALIHAAVDILGTTVTSVWGMTESLASTMTEPGRAAELSPRTDGKAVAGMEVKIVDEAGQTLPVGQRGRLMVRGAQVHIGYLGLGLDTVFDAGGWTDTGDLAYMVEGPDCEGYIRIAGRTKDVIIRGGENVPVVEIENLLIEHPAVAAVALVGYPDDRLGERACAFIVLDTAQSFTLQDLQSWLDSKKVAKQYWPERIAYIDAMPRTPSGKIQKFELKNRL